MVADIHFHHRLALEAINQGVDCLRLNPGNIRDSEKVKEIVMAAKHKSIPIRIGVNFGSLPPVGGIGRIGGFHRLYDMVNQLPKAGNEKAYKRLSEMVPYPLHLGITEAGTVRSGSIRSAVGLGFLLYEGIGDTIRVSLSGDSLDEVEAGFDILKSLNLRDKGPTLVACPSCGRADVDVVRLANDVDKLLKSIDTSVKVAVMGCEVNGPGEAKDADVGIAAGNGRAIIFRKGIKSRVVKEEDMLIALMEEVDLVAKEIESK